MLARIVGGLGAAAAALLGWGWFEAGWVRLRTVDVDVPELPPELDGLRIAHLSDFHLGVPSGSGRAVERAVAWVEERQPDLVLLTGDLLTHPRGEPKLRELLRRLGPRTYAVLGNHDFGDARDPLAAPEPARRPLARASAPRRLGRARAARPARAARGIDPGLVSLGPRGPRWPRGRRRGPPHPALPLPVRLRPARSGAYQLVLAGHLHDGQIAIPYGRGKVRLAHGNWRYTKGLYRRGGSALHVSPGLGTTFVPFRFFARPEATELVLRLGT